MRVVLDTNVFHGDVHARRDWFKALFASSVQGDLEIVVPQVVLDELIRQYPERIAKVNRDLQLAIAHADITYIIGSDSGIDPWLRSSAQ